MEYGQHDANSIVHFNETDLHHGKCEAKMAESKRVKVYFLSHSNPKATSHPHKGSIRTSSMVICTCIVCWKVGHLLLANLFLFATITIRESLCYTEHPTWLATWASKTLCVVPLSMRIGQFLTTPLILVVWWTTLPVKTWTQISTPGSWCTFLLFR